MIEAVALWGGPCHVLLDGNDAFRSQTPPEAFGLPIREFFIRYWTEAHDMMDAVYADGITRTYHFGSRAVIIVRWYQEDRSVGGVGTYARLGRAPRPLPLPLPQLTA